MSSLVSQIFAIIFIATVVSQALTQENVQNNLEEISKINAEDYNEEIEEICIKKHPNIHLINSKLCGPMNKSFKIYEFPWMVLLAYQYRDLKENVFLASGTIINAKYIMTAAHCINFSDSFKLVKIRAGEYDLLAEKNCETSNNGYDYQCAQCQDYEVESTHVHPDYNSTNFQNDIALIRLKEKIIFENIPNTNIRPICLPVGSASYMYQKNFIMTGWGASESGIFFNNVLQKHYLPLVSLNDCIKAFQDQPRIIITKKQICAGGEANRDACNGDSGGPLQAPIFYQGRIRFVQYGIVSFGKRICGTKGFPGVYTKVAFYMKWILDTIAV